MKCYVSFVIRNNKFEILEFKGLSKKVTEFNLRNNGYKIKLTLSKNVFEEYKKKLPYYFWEKYDSKFIKNEIDYIMKNMFEK